MRYFIYFFIFFISTLSADNLNSYGVLNKHAYPLTEGKLEIRAGYLKVNDTIDILNIKEKELGGLKRFGNIGDMNGNDIEFRYGLNKYNSLFFNFQNWDIDYTGSSLKNKRVEFFNKYNFFNDTNGFFNNYSIDIGYINNRANDLELRNDDILNSMINKIKPDSNVKIDDGNIIMSDVTISLYDKFGAKIYPYLSIGDLESNSYYARFLTTKRLSTNSILDLYLTYKVTDLTTEISFYPDNISLIDSYLSDIDIPVLSRSEDNIEIGLLYLYKVNDYILEFNYEYNKLFRDKKLEYMNKNNIINMFLSKKISDNVLVYLGGRAMFQQFNTDIPYLYNQYSQTQFDKKYGFAQLGLIYSF